MKLKAHTWIFLLLIFSQSIFAQVTPPKVDLSLAKEIDHSIKLGLKYLYDQQEDDGSWQHYPAITGLVLSAYLRAHPSISESEPMIADGFAFLSSCIKPDGSIYTDDMPTYNTSICLIAFKDANNPAYDQIIKNAEDFLMGIQVDESIDMTTDSLFYGGMGYDGEHRPDLSNLQWAVEAMAIDARKAYDPEKNMTDEEKTRIMDKNLFYDKALVFLARCQNLQNVNPEAYAQNDGGFMYNPGVSKAGGSDSYASMTYAGMKSMIYARVAKDDPRVQAAYDWISSHYAIETTPLLGLQGLYYYYQTMAKAMNAYGTETIQSPDGTAHPWRYDLANQLIKTQAADGSWVNENGRWWENNPVLVTAYVLLTLEEIAGLPESTTIKKRNVIIK